MNTQPRILVLGAQHGDEHLGPRLNRYLRSDTSGRFATVDYLCGNPRALRQNVRFTETDLNRSYDTKSPTSYEQKRAQKIMRIIAREKYDFVLDIHTSRASVGGFLLVTHLEGAVQKVITASVFERVAVMPPHIADCSLIGQVPQAVSIEYDRRLARSKRTLQELVSLLENLLNSAGKPRLRELFFVSARIAADNPISYDAKNFELCEQGFYPVIFARNGSYSTYKGFAADGRETRII